MSSQSTLNRVLDEVPAEVREVASADSWHVVNTHPSEAACQCVVVAVLASLYDQGYRVVTSEAVEDADSIADRFAKVVMLLNDWDNTLARTAADKAYVPASVREELRQVLTR